MEHFEMSTACSICLPDNSFKFDLQRFSGEKTEEATSKRKTEARNKGQVAKSVELNSAFIILIAFFTLKSLGSYIYQLLADFMAHILFTLDALGRNNFTIQDISVLGIEVAAVFFKASLPIMLSILVVSLIVNFLQVGFNLTLQPLQPKFDKLNPINGVKRLISKRSLVELAKSIIKIIIVGYLVYRFLYHEIEYFPKLINLALSDAMQYIGMITTNLALQIGFVILLLAACDYFYQWWEHKQSIKMSKHDVKEEYKQTEGNPQIKGKIKERQRAMAMRRMMQEVPAATVVVTNPTHFAVALKYTEGMAAPIVVAKGQDFIAAKIKTLAYENKVTVVENKLLARSLYSSVEIGEAVPPHLYQAVAEVLAYVYRINKKMSIAHN